jgi:hypothetical protein
MDVTVMVYVALFPAVTVVPEGVADNEKSWKKTDNAMVADCPPALPVTVKL